MQSTKQYHTQLRKLKVITPIVHKDNIQIIPMQEEHFDEVMDIDASYSTKPWSRELFFNELKNNFSFNFVLKYNSEVIGFINFWVVCEVLELNNFAIREDYRNMGMGTYFLEFLIEVAKFFKVKKIFLDVKKDNFKARYLYKKFGFKEIGIRVNYYDDGNDAILMEAHV